MSRKDAFVRLDEVSFTYGNQTILDHIHLTLEKGKSYALIGKSGVGKSTLLNVIAGFIHPNQGSVMINGQVLKKPRENTAFLFQDLGLFPWQTVFEAILMPLHLKNMKDKRSGT